MPLLALGYALFFAASALAKLDSWETWRRSAEGWLSRKRFVGLVTVGLPMLEGFTAATLLLWPVPGLWTASTLLGVLGLGVLAMMRTSRGRQCGCFGMWLPEKIGARLAIRNLLMAVIAAEIAVLGGGSIKVVRAPAIDLLIAGVLAAFVVVAIEHKRFVGWPRPKAERI